MGNVHYDAKFYDRLSSMPYKITFNLVNKWDVLWHYEMLSHRLPCHGTKQPLNFTFCNLHCVSTVCRLCWALCCQCYKCCTAQRSPDSCYQPSQWQVCLHSHLIGEYLSEQALSLFSFPQISIEELDIIYKIPHCVPLSAHHKWNFDDLLEKMWDYLSLTR